MTRPASDGDCAKYATFLRSCWASWNAFWFTPASPLPLGLIRVCAGAVVLWLLSAYSPDLDEFLGENAWYSRNYVNRLRNSEVGVPRPGQPRTWDSAREVTDEPRSHDEQRYFEEWRQDPRGVSVKGYPAFSIYFHIGDALSIRWVHGVCLFVIVLFMMGFWTRITSVLAWLVFMSYVQRSPATAFGADAMASVLLLYLMLGPSGATLSVDCLLSRWVAIRQARRLGIPLPPWRPAKQTVSANVVIRLLQIHLCIIYFVAGATKLSGAMWWDHTVIWHVLVNPEFAPNAIRPPIDMIRFLSRHRLLCELLMSGATLLTLFTEIGFPFLVWRQSMRKTMVCCAILLHSGIGMLMGLYSFGAIMGCMNIAFLDPTWLGSGYARNIRHSFSDQSQRVCSTFDGRRAE